ncbi:acyltransferase family protein [Geobacillus stearothermophilus]
MKERDYYFDNAKCALMLLVVFGHFLRPYIDGVLWVHSLYTWIFFFHMPAFIFISGYFAKKFYEHGYLQKNYEKAAHSVRSVPAAVLGLLLLPVRQTVVGT